MRAKNYSTSDRRLRFNHEKGSLATSFLFLKLFDLQVAPANFDAAAGVYL